MRKSADSAYNQPMRRDLSSSVTDFLISGTMKHDGTPAIHCLSLLLGYRGKCSLSGMMEPRGSVEQVLQERRTQEITRRQPGARTIRSGRGLQSRGRKEEKRGRQTVSPHALPFPSRGEVPPALKDLRELRVPRRRHQPRLSQRACQPGTGRQRGDIRRPDGCAGQSHSINKVRQPQSPAECRDSLPYESVPARITGNPPDGANVMLRRTTRTL